MTYHLSVKTGGKGAAGRHAKYIGRRGAFESKSEDLVDTFSGNLPGWTSGDTTKFWQTADKYERSNAAVYREYEGALPAELTHTQMREALEEWMQHVAPNKPYEVAIHEPLPPLVECHNRIFMRWFRIGYSMESTDRRSCIFDATTPRSRKQGAVKKTAVAAHPWPCATS